jgi:ABC-type phosphate transport system substrate-binding protein
MKKISSAIAISLVIGAGTATAGARDYIYVVGSSTVYPFATVVAEHFGKSSRFKTPKIESTGSGGGMKLFCQGVGVKHPDITNASRRIKKSEFDKCQANGVKEIVEIKIGYDGIAIANSKAAPQFNLSRKDIFLALAKQIPDPKAPESGKLVPNPYSTWNEINPSLPAYKIEVLGPPPTSGTRDAFAELAMEGGCKQFSWIKQIKKDSKKAKKAADKELAKQLKNKYKAICHGVREDGKYVEAGENDNTELKRVEAVRRDFIADVSHELRTPLTVVAGYLEMLADEPNLPEDVHGALLASQRLAERMQSIVADLLMLSRLELEEDEPQAGEWVDVPELLQGLVQDARRLGDEAGHQIQLHADADLGLVGVESELGSAFGNLIFNGVQHTPARTPIDIYWGKNGDGARLVVADQGPGIAPEHLQRLTERFYRVDKSRSRDSGGTGLGLSIVRHVLKRHEAVIEIQSTPGEGSRFVCLFPASRVVKLSS